MGEEILRIEAVQLVGPFELHLRFNDGATRRVDLLPALTGPVFAPLRDAEYFSRVALDPVAGTVVWPNGADFAPDYLRALPEAEERTGESDDAAHRSVGAGKVSDKPSTRRRATRR